MILHSQNGAILLHRVQRVVLGVTSKSGTFKACSVVVGLLISD